ncbi:MAG: hypothetical protein HGB14_06800 [Anaerolineaceae bacterium]|nr:hypothetical protein [Anaerolineaceae bacterium]
MIDNDPLLDEMDLLKGKTAVDQKDTAYYCYEHTCTQPMTTIEEFFSEYKKEKQITSTS